MSKQIKYDVDQVETNDWLLAFDSLIREEGVERAQYILEQLLERARANEVDLLSGITTDYINTISVSEEPHYPGNLNVEGRIRVALRWNAIMIVLRASKKNLELGGHMASYQSAASIYEVGFNHFFRARSSQDGGDLVFFQGHIAPGIYARAFIEGRLTEEQLNNFRQEVDGKGLSSYPHPRLMPDFWQFPTVSMGLGPLNAIYHARFLKYLEHRGIKDTSNQTVYAFLGDGEMDEPESKGSITFAAREKLDNLIFVINCNLQRLDGPVFGNGKIIQEFEGIFNGAGWEVIKVIWGKRWDRLLQKDTTGKLLHLMNEVLDGDYQTLKSKNGAYVRKHFFGRYPETAALVQDMTDDEIWDLRRGGHDSLKIFSAFDRAKKARGKGKPVVLLIQTVKGYGMGEAGEGKNIAHQVKKIDMNELKHIRDRFYIPIDDNEIEKLPYIQFDKESEEYKYLHERRQALGGYLPARLPQSSKEIEVPPIESFAQLFEAQSRPISTTMAFVRTLNILLKDRSLGKRVVPIIADEARTFGMEGLFRQIGIYNSYGQNYVPQDRELVAYYRESTDGQVLQEGINELGATASWLAAATSYSTNDEPMIPFFVYYSMFGFQRVGDLLWAAGDQRARGFMIGGTSGRTTLNGEGLQHQDGHSHLLAATLPSCVSFDPAFAFEVPVIIQYGLQRMYGDKEDLIFYITVLNETYDQPAMPKGVEEGIRKGIYLFETVNPKGKTKVQLLGCGAILRHVREAAEILAKEYGICSDVYSVTSFTELAREADEVKRWNTLHPNKKTKVPYITQVMNQAPAIAATDYIKLFAEQVRAYVPAVSYSVLGTDGFGRSDSRENLRSHFEVNTESIVVTVLSDLAANGSIDKKSVTEAIKKYGIDTEKGNPLYA